MAEPFKAGEPRREIIRLGRVAELCFCIMPLRHLRQFGTDPRRWRTFRHVFGSVWPTYIALVPVAGVNSQDPIRRPGHHRTRPPAEPLACDRQQAAGADGQVHGRARALAGVSHPGGGEAASREKALGVRPRVGRPPAHVLRADRAQPGRPGRGVFPVRQRVGPVHPRCRISPS